MGTGNEGPHYSLRDQEMTLLNHMQYEQAKETT